MVGEARERGDHTAPQRGGGVFFLLVGPIANQRHERRDATGLCDGNLVVGTQMCENLQRAGGGCFLRVVPIAHQRHERRDATGLCDGNSVVGTY